MKKGEQKNNTNNDIYLDKINIMHAKVCFSLKHGQVFKYNKAGQWLALSSIHDNRVVSYSSDKLLLDFPNDLIVLRWKDNMEEEKESIINKKEDIKWKRGYIPKIGEIPPLGARFINMAEPGAIVTAYSFDGKKAIEMNNLLMVNNIKRIKIIFESSIDEDNNELFINFIDRTIERTLSNVIDKIKIITTDKFQDKLGELFEIANSEMKEDLDILDNKIKEFEKLCLGE